MITAVFQSNEDYARVYGLWQWDYGQELRIQGLDLPAAVEIHFALQESGGEAITRVGVTQDGVTTVPIPDSMLEGAGSSKDYQIYAWVYLADPARGETVKRITMQVKARPKPEAFEAPGDGEIFHEAIEAVNDAAKRAEEAGGKAAAAADDARGAAAQTAEHLEVVQGLTEQVEINADTVAQDKQAVAGMVTQTQQAASEAALSAEAAKLSETAAGQAQAGAEAAEDTARQYAGEAEADRRAVAEDKQTVTQMREAVEQTAAQFGQTAQDALTAIGQAQSTAVGAVKAEGQKQTTAVQEAGTQAVKDVATAKTEAVQAVTAEGDKQTKRVEEAAAGVEADRDQIGKNKADIAGLAEGMADLAPGIKITAAGTDISIKDAAEGRELRGLRVFGRSQQVQTTGINLLPFEIGTESNDGSFKVLTDGIYIKTEVNTDFYAVGKAGNTESSYENAPLLTPGDYYAVMDRLVSNVIFYVVAWREGKSNILVDTSTQLTQKFTVQEGDKFRIFIRSTNFAGKIKPMITKDQPDEYEPYTSGQPSPSPDYPQEIEIAGGTGNIEVAIQGKNLLRGRLYHAKYSSGIGFIYNEDEMVLPYTPSKENDGIAYVVPCEPGKQYTFSISNPNENAAVGIAEYKTFEDAKNHQNAIGYRTVALPETSYTSKSQGVLLCVLAAKWTDGNTSLHECTESELLQLELGSNVTAYEHPKTLQSITLQTPNGLPGIPVTSNGNYTDANGQQWVCDEIDFEREKYVQRVAEYVWNPNDNFSVDKSAIHINSILVDLKVNNASNYSTLRGYYILCNGLNACTKSGMLYNTDEVSCGYTDNSNFLRARLPIEAGTTYESVKAYLTNLPYMLRFIYILATPVERDLTPEELAAYKALRTYSPTTAVSNDAGAWMEATYIADTKTYIDNKFAALNKTILDAVGGT